MSNFQMLTLLLNVHQQRAASCWNCSLLFIQTFIGSNLDSWIVVLSLSLILFILKSFKTSSLFDVRKTELLGHMHTQKMFYSFV